jgi:hypothetical protein
MKALQQEALAQKFLIGSHNAVRLRRSLAAGQRQDLIDRTLLTPEVHKVHAKRLSDRYLKQWTKKRDQATRNWQKLPPSLRMANAKPTEHDIAAAQYRFLTVVDSVTAVDAGDALRAVIKLKEKLQWVRRNYRKCLFLKSLHIQLI